MGYGHFSPLVAKMRYSAHGARMCVSEEPTRTLHEAKDLGRPFQFRVRSHRFSLETGVLVVETGLEEIGWRCRSVASSSSLSLPPRLVWCDLRQNGMSAAALARTLNPPQRLPLTGLGSLLELRSSLGTQSRAKKIPPPPPQRAAEPPALGTRIRTTIEGIGMSVSRYPLIGGPHDYYLSFDIASETGTVRLLSLSVNKAR
ncbi:hypothetical protein B0I35DRAFT_51565 [Stachybotrys elegans]|uniref:Uncharacterized protein n=1 Tax=Stachybotrys elegans TaxID=80388 RepID=A0A8K0SQC2_9HYPO|nr:hypothetical protein B0I35DRAFT_51565 [Stachybotrys elegans]